MKLNIIGAGLAGCEAAWQAANNGIEVQLFEMKKAGKFSDAHKSDNFAELVCSNSFRNSDLSSAIGILQYELRALNSLIMLAADHNQVPAGGALAVDRDGFSDFITNKIINHPKIRVIAQEVTSIDDYNEEWIIAAGPLCSEELSKFIQNITGKSHLAFFDAIAPVVYKDSINFDIAWYQSRYDKGNGKDYINCPMNKEQYDNFVNSIIEAEKTQFKEWEKNTPYFEGCLPIEVMASRGIETLRFGPMKPVGLIDPRTNERPYAVVQLRQDNLPATLYNIVGFQTKMKYGEQSQLFRQIPGLENAEFARLGGIHRNSFINSPTLLANDLSLHNRSNIKFAGQITGVEGYIESTSIGLLAGLFASRKIIGLPLVFPPEETAIGSLLAHITVNANKDLFQPMNINFGLFPDPKVKNKKDKKTEISNIATKSIMKWKEELWEKV